MEYTIDKIEENYELELDRIVSEIGGKEAKTVLLQLPDGLKPWGPALVDYIEEKTSSHVSIWLGDCFGACDVPNSNVDLLIQFGHAPWS